MRIHKSLQALLLITAMAAAIAACTKTELLPLEERVKNRILEYKIVNDNEPLLGAIDHVNNTITVYRPYYSGVEVLIPEIKLEAGTILIDIQGQEINLDGGLEPVPVAAPSYQYRVKGSDDKVRTYDLVIKTQVYPKTLKVGYAVTAWGSDAVDETIEKEMVLGGSVNLFGNFESTSANARFEAIHRATGKSVDNLVSLGGIIVQNGSYVATLKTNIEADTGYYDITMHHQGRTAKLAPLHLVLRKPGMFTFTNAADWQKAPGDTIRLVGYTANTHFPYNATLVGLKRAYMKIIKPAVQYSAFPEGFPDSLLNKEIELEIVSYSRAEFKFRMPNLPVGTYVGQASAGGHSTLGHNVQSATFGIYFDYEDWTGWGSDNLTSFARNMEVLSK